MTVDSALGVSIPAHHAGDFAGEQNSLHVLVVKWESSEKGFPYLLGTQLLGRLRKECVEQGLIITSNDGNPLETGAGAVS
jgi:hypothetical protein